MERIKVLVACEESQAVTTELRTLGIEAWSCDVQASSGNMPEFHIQDDALYIIEQNNWDMIIAFPPCTFLTTSGAVWLYRGGVINQERLEKGIAAKEFFMKILTARCQYICIENPTPMHIFSLPKPTQVVQPYFFGDPFVKRTLLWLKGLPPLKHSKTNTLFERCSWVQPKAHWVNSSSNYRGSKLSKGRHRSKKQRSKTFSGIAKAMAMQWSEYLEVIHWNTKSRI